MRFIDPYVSPKEKEEQAFQKEGEEMSIFAEYRHGLISREEFLSECRREEAKDKAYEDAKWDRYYEDQENEEDEDDD